MLQLSLVEAKSINSWKLIDLAELRIVILDYSRKCVWYIYIYLDPRILLADSSRTHFLIPFVSA